MEDATLSYRQSGVSSVIVSTQGRGMFPLLIPLTYHEGADLLHTFPNAYRDERDTSEVEIRVNGWLDEVVQLAP
jgi:hypothetical protein